jgi:hypothetical protein
VTRNTRPNRSTEPRAWWQRVIAGERLPNPPFRRSKCEGIVEDHRNVALDVRELIRKHVFDQPVGSVFRLSVAYPWLRIMRLKSSSLDLELMIGPTVVVPLVWASCGVMGSGCGYNARCVLGACARSTIFTEGSLVGTAVAFGTRRNGPVALRESI